MKQKQIQQLFQQRYNQQRWKEFLAQTFTNAHLYSSPDILPDINTDVAVQALLLGYIKLNENGIERNIAVYDVTLAPGIVLERNRVGLRNLLRKFWRDIDGAFIVFHRDGVPSWRFTYVSELKGFDADGEWIEIKTEPKRYTYVLGELESCRTASERFALVAEKGGETTLDDIKEAFSVEKLSKSFFDEYKRQYELFCDYMIAQPSIFRSIFEGDDKAVRDFTKKMLGRIVFLFFIQKKGWMGVPENKPWGEGDLDFLGKLFNNCKHPELFYSEYLCKLFFNTLNTQRPNDITEIIPGEKIKIPFLNGGLFEEDNPKFRNLIFPEELFSDLFDFFNQYNFTIYEDDPNDQTVAVDPEILGHIFENLLEDNKDKGAFYTPKEIVHYMCQESLIEYLTTHFEGKGYEVTNYHASFDKQNQPELFPVNEGRKGQLTLEATATSNSKKIDRVLIEKLLKQKLDDADRELVLKHAHEFNKALDKVKICDPAIGSGAFPMGLLKEIFNAKQTLHTFKHGSTKGFDASTVKLNIIQNSIYGVDIEKGAVDIARLRFWLSLVVDEETPKVLPNLDYKIVVGDSLVSKLGDDIIDIDWTLNEVDNSLFGSDLVHQKLELLKEISIEQKEFFNPHSDKKKQAINIRNLKIDLLINQLGLMVKTANQETKPSRLNFSSNKKFVEATELYLQSEGWKKQINKLQTLKAQPNKRLKFFDWKLDFPEIMNEQVTNSVGFDIVIGNPPYIESKKLKHISKYLRRYTVYSGTSDLSSYFFESGFNICKASGLLYYINTNKFFNTGYGKPLRAFILKNKIKQLINFEQVEVFEGILVSSVIIGFKKMEPSAEHCFPYKEFYKLKNEEFKEKFVEQVNNPTTYDQNFLTEEEWSFSDKINLLLKYKIEKKAVNLIDIEGVSIYRGITTGYNPAFIINTDKKNELITANPNNNQVIKPLLQGRNIRKWIYNYNNENLIFVPWHFPLHLDNSISGASKLAEEKLKSDYPFIYNHLLEYKTELSNRNQEETGIRYEWYALQRCAASYYSEFEKDEKIIWGLTANNWAFAYDAQQHFLPSNGYILTSEKTSLKYLLGIINSNLLKYYFGFIGVMTAGGAFTLKHTTIRQMPFIVAKNKEIIINIVDKILFMKKEDKDTFTLEQALDNLVYKLYELTYDEVKVIDPEFELCEEEYNSLEIE